MKPTKDETRRAKIHAALSHAARVRLISHLSMGSERHVTDLTKVIGMKQPPTSHHLMRLRQAGLVTHRRDGRWIWYKTTAMGDMMAGLELP